MRYLHQPGYVSSPHESRTRALVQILTSTDLSNLSEISGQSSLISRLTQVTIALLSKRSSFGFIAGWHAFRHAHDERCTRFSALIQTSKLFSWCLKLLPQYAGDVLLTNYNGMFFTVRVLQDDRCGSVQGRIGVGWLPPTARPVSPIECQENRTDLPTYTFLSENSITAAV